MARLFPPEAPSPGEDGRCIFYNMLRPELVRKKSRIPALSSDAFSMYGYYFFFLSSFLFFSPFFVPPFFPLFFFLLIRLIRINRWGRADPQSGAYNLDVAAATKFLHEKMIPKLARQLDKVMKAKLDLMKQSIQAKASDPLREGPVLVVRPSSLFQISLESRMNLSYYFHKKGGMELSPIKLLALPHQSNEIIFLSL